MNLLKRIFLRLLAFLVLLSVIFISCEALVRITLGNQIPLLPRNVTSASFGDFKIRINTPGLRYQQTSQDGRWEVRINSRGLRSDREFSKEKPEGVQRILLIGDSFTMASEVDIEDSFGSIIERELGRKGWKVEVINTGVSGYSNSEELVVLENLGLKFHPDVVIQSFFINDYADNLRAGLYQLNGGRLEVSKKEYAPGGSVQEFLRRFPLYLWVTEHSYFYNYLNRVMTLVVKGKLEKQNTEKLIAEVGVSDLDKYQEDLAHALVMKASQLSRRHGAAFILMDIPTFWAERSVKFADRLEEGRDLDVFADIQGLFQNETDINVIYRPHGDRHWTELGHRKVGEYLAEKIELILRQRQTARQQGLS